MKRLIFVNRYFFPDQSATSQLLTDLAFYLANGGRNIHVVTSRQLYEDAKATLTKFDTAAGVTIHRVFSTRFGRQSLVGRAVDYLSFYAAALLKLVTFVRADDIVIAKTDPPLISIVAMLAVWLRRATLVNWLQDIYPEIATEMGLPVMKGPVASCLALLRNTSLNLAAANVVLSNQMATRLRTVTRVSSLIHVIPNWCDDEDIVPISPTDNPLRQAWGLQDKFIIGYSGNLGRGHEFNTILEASKCFKNDERFAFVVIGGGHRFEEFKQQVKANGLGPIYRFFPYQERALLKYSLSVPDLHWISLQTRFSDLMFPSKLYGIAAAGRPILALTGKEGGIAQLLREHECGIALEVGDVSATADAIAALERDRERCRKMGANARAMLDSKFTKRLALQSWNNLLNSLDE